MASVASSVRPLSQSDAAKKGERDRLGRGHRRLADGFYGPNGQPNRERYRVAGTGRLDAGMRFALWLRS